MGVRKLQFWPSWIIAFSKHDLQFVIFINTFLVNLAIELFKKTETYTLKVGEKKTCYRII